MEQIEPIPGQKQSLAQKILLYSVYALVLLMVVFSLIASKDKNYAGYEKCVQHKCEIGGDKYCQKAREQQNCCLGAGGTLAMNNNKFTCVFS